MSTDSATSGGATVESFLAIPEDERFHELIGGEIIRKASPSGEHADAQGGVIGSLRGPFQRKPGGGGPGGWWIYPEPEVELTEGTVVRPDVGGWRREHCPERPTGTLVRIRPDWVCEVVSPSHANHDRVRKLRLYHQHGVPYYWLVDPRDATLTVMRWSEDGYVTLLSAERGEVVRAEPFDAIELELGVLFGDDPSV
ncbi:MAG: Uma2 family endonuclease [Myxococcales bacterium]|nr:Uma2 family endonuclease [Myxococcales bacterium]